MRARRSLLAVTLVSGLLASAPAAGAAAPGVSVASAATHFSVTGLASTVTAGTAGTITVKALDGAEQVDKNYAGTVSFSSTDLIAALPADYTFVPADAGVHSFPVTLRTAGTRSVTATDFLTAITGRQSGIEVVPGPATRLTVDGMSSPRAPGAPGTVLVSVFDACGNTATGYRGTVHVYTSDQWATVPADYTFTASDAGEHTFTVTFNSGGVHVVTARDTKTFSIMGSQGEIHVVYPEGTYHPVTPARVLDSRPTASGHTNIGLSGTFAAGTVRSFKVAGVKGLGASAAIPTNATAVTGNLTIVGETASGVVALGPLVSSSGLTTTLNVTKGDIRANNVTLALGPGGTLAAVYRAASGATTDLIFDVTGYFTPDTTGARYSALAPGRVLDTRPTVSGHTNIGLQSAFQSGVVRTFKVAGVKALGWQSALVPSTATGVTGNLTVTNASSDGFVALGPTMTATPATSTLNTLAASNRANGVTVALQSGSLQAVWKGRDGSSADLIFDVTGYFTSGTSGLLYHPIMPVRLMDSSSNTDPSGPFKTNTPRNLQLAGVNQIVAGAMGVSGNLTILSPSSSGFAFVGPSPVATLPSSSTVNTVASVAVANGFDVGLSSGGAVGVVWAGTAGSTANLALDVTGYWK